MKTLIVMRHAKTEERHIEGDHSRELTDRGRRDAAAAAQSIADQGLRPEVILSSTAERAVQTAKIIAATFQSTPFQMQNDALYLADAETILDVVHELEHGVDVAVLVGHNPGLLDFINLLLDGDGERASLPTSAYAIAESEIDDWVSLKPGSVQISPIVIP